MLDSLWQSLVIFFVAVKAYDGLDIGIWQFGATIVSACLVTMLCHFALEVRTWVSDERQLNLFELQKVK